nr:VCBS repeat-containing protein [Bacteroidales bacterium]
VFSLNLNSQPFVYIDAGFSGVMQSAGSWIDYNNDTYPDVFITGEKYSGNKQILVSNLYTNLKDGTFKELNNYLPEVYRSSVDWGDYDKDGDSDLLLCGETYNDIIITNIYRNNGKGVLSLLNTQLTPVRDGSVDWGDYDKDGDLDILLTGESYNRNLVAKIYRNDGKNIFSPINPGLEPVYLSSAKWGDYNNDGNLDILLTGQTYNETAITKVYKNTGNNNFTALPLMLENLRMSDVGWCDFNNDGKLDFIICGENFNNQIFTTVYKNIGNDKFIKVKTEIQGVRSGNIDLGDYDCDGDIDILISGESYEEAITKVYRNDGKFVFTDIFAGLPGVYMGAAYWGDYDKDCDKDILILGLNICDDYIAKLYRNDGEIIKKKAPKKEIEMGIWTTSTYHIPERGPFYYFMYSSCYCNPYKKGDDFYAFVSNIHYTKTPYDLHNIFNNLIRKNLSVWPKIDQGHRVSIGYKTKAAAAQARANVIREYESEEFHIRYVEW